MDRASQIFSPEFLSKLRHNSQSLESNSYGLCQDTLGEDEITAAVEVLASFKVTMGAKVREFEKQFARHIGAKHALMANSGSSANLLGIAAMIYRQTKNLSKGDEVLVPALAWPTTVWPIAQLGLKPVYVDVNATDMSVSLESCEKALTPKTRALFLIHVLGAPANLTEIQKFCNKHNLLLMEDCCESLGATWNNKHVGTWGEYGTFSFYYSHHMTTIEGGMIVTNDDHTADTLLSLRAHGWVRDRSDRAEWTAKYPHLDDRFLFILPGFNLRPMEIQAAIGLEQLKKLDAMIAGRKKTAALIIEAIEKSGAACRLASTVQKDGVHSWMAIPFLVDDGVNRSEFCKILDQNGVETRPIIAGNLARHPASELVSVGRAPSLDFCDKLWNQGFMIGCHPQIRPEQVQTLKAAFAKTPTKR